MPLTALRRGQMQPVEYPGGTRRSAREPRRRRRDGEDDREAVGAVMAQQTGAEPDEDAPIEEDEFDEEDAAASLDASDDEDDVLPVPKQSKKAKKAAARAAVQQAGVRITVRFSLAKAAGGGGGYVASKTNIKTFIVPADMIRWCPTTKMRYITVARVVELTKVQRCNLFGRIVDTRSSQVVETFNTALGDVEIAIDRSDKHLTLAAKEKTKPLEAVAPDDSSESETEAPVAVPVTTKSKALQRPEDNATLTQTYALADRLRIDSVEDDWFEKSGGAGALPRPRGVCAGEEVYGGHGPRVRRVRRAAAPVPLRVDGRRVETPTATPVAGRRRRRQSGRGRPGPAAPKHRAAAADARARLR